MTSLVNKSADWTPNYHKILIFFSTKSLKSLHAARIDELADSNEPAMMDNKKSFVLAFDQYEWFLRDTNKQLNREFKCGSSLTIHKWDAWTCTMQFQQ